MSNGQTIGDATVDEHRGPPPQQPEPGSGAPHPAPDGREYWRRRALRAELVILGLHERIAALVKGAT